MLFSSVKVFKCLVIVLEVPWAFVNRLHVDFQWNWLSQIIPSLQTPFKTENGNPQSSSVIPQLKSYGFDCSWISLAQTT